MAQRHKIEIDCWWLKSSGGVLVIDQTSLLGSRAPVLCGNVLSPKALPEATQHVKIPTHAHRPYGQSTQRKPHVVSKPARDPRSINANLSLSPWIYYFTAGQTARIAVKPGLKTNPQRHFHSYGLWNNSVRVLVIRSHFTSTKMLLPRFERAQTSRVGFSPSGGSKLAGDWQLTCLEGQGTFALIGKQTVVNCTFQFNFIYIASLQLCHRNPEIGPATNNRKTTMIRRVNLLLMAAVVKEEGGKRRQIGRLEIG